VRESKTFKLAFVGSHGVGKTTLCYGLAARLKARDMSLEVVREVARRCPLPINEETSLAAQSWILHTQIAEELVAEEHYDVVICDRSALDNYVYLLLAEGSQPDLETLIDHWMHTYDLLVHAPVIERPSADGVRSDNPAFQLAVEERLQREVAERGLPCLDLAHDCRDDWVEQVEGVVVERLAPPQLELL
jgi:nicotinamide riboside kinase